MNRKKLKYMQSLLHLEHNEKVKSIDISQCCDALITIWKAPL